MGNRNKRSIPKRRNTSMRKKSFLNLSGIIVNGPTIGAIRSEEIK